MRGLDQNNHRKISPILARPLQRSVLMMSIGLSGFGLAVEGYAATQHTFQNLERIFQPAANEDYKNIQLSQLAQFSLDQSALAQAEAAAPAGLKQNLAHSQIQLKDAILFALQRHPELQQSLYDVAAQNANIDVVKAQYYPQLSAGMSTGNFNSSQRGRQVLSLNATQMLYDFGKVKSSVEIQNSQLSLKQANVLLTLQDVAAEVANSIVQIQRYQVRKTIAEQQVIGIQNILKIAKLRAEAGISSQADPIQAQSYLQAAESSLITEQSFLAQYQQRLGTILGFDVRAKHWILADEWVKASALFDEPDYNKVPKILLAQTEVDVAQAQKRQTQLSRYPTLALKASLNQALNGSNPNNNKDDAMYSSIMLEANSQFYQGGAIAAQNRSANAAEQAARAKVNAVYLEVLEQVRTSREDIQNKQRQMQVLTARKQSTVQTRELYQEQYKLGTRSVLDLLNAEMSIHSAQNELENARYDIYSSLVQFIQTTGRSAQAYQLNHISIQGFEVQP